MQSNKDTSYVPKESMSSVVRAFTSPKSPTFTFSGLSKEKKILDGYIAKRRKRKSCYAGNLKPLAKWLYQSQCVTVGHCLKGWGGGGGGDSNPRDLMIYIEFYAEI